MNSSTGYTLENYRRLINAFKEAGYVFEAYSHDAPSGKTVYLRHDIDYTLSFAETFSQINIEEGVRATFFFQMRSGLYNILNYSTQKVIRRIIERKQFIGFHAVVDKPFNSLKTLRQWLETEYAFFKSIIPEAQPVFAWHNPGILKAGGFFHIDAEFPGYINAYGLIGGEKTEYVADSNMRYSFHDLLALPGKGYPSLQLAIAPMQWCPEQPEMKRIMVDNLIQKVKDLEVNFMENYVYSKMYPKGLPQEIFLRLRGLCLENEHCSEETN